MTCTLLIPGLDAARDPHWMAWWQKNDPMAMTLLPDDLSDPHPDAWEAEIAGALLHHPSAILVAHGAGALVVAQMLATWPHLKIAGALLVAPVDPDLDPRLQHFTQPDPSACPVPMTIVASRNDPHQPFARARALARDYGAGFVDLGAAGHIDAAAGFGPWEPGFSLRNALAQQAGQALRQPAPQVMATA